MAMQGKQVLITGSTAGIGKAAAMALARLGAGVTIHERNAMRCEEVAKEIRAATGNANIDTLAFDLSSLKSVRKAADAYQARHPKLDVLALNAGIAGIEPAGSTIRIQGIAAYAAWHRETHRTQGSDFPRWARADIQHE
jgi:NAD(P)-dependent dehydrogenase (short-subunit alcohol dehydrogenase family)